MKICATGHRPKGLGVSDPYSPATFNRLAAVAGAWFDRHPEVSEVISGMALGWDQAVAVAAIARMLPVHAHIPCAGQADSWPVESHIFYQKLLRQCSSTRIICHGAYHPGMMQARNEAMVNDSAMVLALWSGEPGGTANAVAYADSLMVPVENVWQEFLLEM